MLKLLKKWIRFYFGFSRTETNGTLVLIFLMIIFMITPMAWEKFGPEIEYDGTLDNQILDSVIATLEPKFAPQVEPQTSMATQAPPAPAFPFDPNVASYQDLIRLDLPDFLAKRVIKYRQNGGKFRTKTDLSKIFGLPPETYQRLSDYILLPETIDTKMTPRSAQSKLKLPPPKFDINLADTSQLRAISGIGQVRASRIIKYRDWLGGFISDKQYQELWGLDREVLLQLQNATFISPYFVPQQINLDSSDAKTLARHPYISYQLADVIVAYRDQHGLFKDLQALQEISIVNDSILNRISPYLKKSP